MVARLYLNFDYGYVSFLSPSQPPALQQQFTTFSHVSLLSLSVSTIILEFILWTTNLRKHINFIQLQIFKLT
jgi:hypothetical protein